MLDSDRIEDRVKKELEWEKKKQIDEEEDGQSER